MKIIIDTDPGVDDAMAILYGHAAPDIELIGLTTVFGNVLVDQSTRNALYLAEMLEADLPVAQGAAQPYDFPEYEPSTFVHGEEGFGDLVDIETSRAPVQETAAEFLVNRARAHKGELVVCAIAPLTNIADALRLDPEFAQNVAKIVIMGGAVDCAGNSTPYAEANIYHDPHAAAEVLNSGAEILLVGLDVTLRTLCDRHDFEEMAEAAPKTGGFLRDISAFYLKFYKDVANEDGCALHDSTALIACTHPELFETDKTGLSVVLEGEEFGNTVRDTTKPEVSVCVDIRAEAVKSLFMRHVKAND